MKYHVIALGGSIVVPHLSDNGGINSSFLRQLRKFLKNEMEKGSRFILVIGGGKTCRVYQKAAREIVRVSNEDLDWLGIHAIRLNAHLLRTVFKKEAYPVVLDHDPSLREVAKLKASRKRLLVESAWRPGYST
ncbi:MAG: UMP kinase, partial [Candidatus Pacearchaeota archaeon]|nr:UMP kinase [Candidatus Pacearchaeota archaeon]